MYIYIQDVRKKKKSFKDFIYHVETRRFDFLSLRYNYFLFHDSFFLPFPRVVRMFLFTPSLEKFYGTDYSILLLSYQELFFFVSEA